MKKEKFLTIREEIDIDKFYEELSFLLKKYQFTNLEFIGLLEFIKEDVFEQIKNEDFKITE